MMWYREAQILNPLRDWKNTKNWWTEETNGDNPAVMLRLMSDGLNRLQVDASKQTWFAGLDQSVRPMALGLVQKILSAFNAFESSFNSQPATTSAANGSVRQADLAMGVARDCNDLIGLLGPLTNATLFGQAGTVLYTQLSSDLTTLSNVLTGQITPQEAAQQAQVSPQAPRLTAAPTTPPQTPAEAPTTPAAPMGAPSAYSTSGEQYMDTTYQRELHQPGSPEWNNEIQNALAWGQKNGGYAALTAKLQGHTSQFIAAVQQAWQQHGWPTA